jgi:hypothetical protein
MPIAQFDPYKVQEIKALKKPNAEKVRSFVKPASTPYLESPGQGGPVVLQERQPLGQLPNSAGCSDRPTSLPLL